MTYQNQVIAAAVHAPILGEMFAATQGQGAFRNDKKIFVSQTTQLEKSLLATGFPYQKAEIENNNVKNFNALLLQVQGIRRCGAAAIDLCYVACGRYDGFWELWLQPHDVAAGSLIISEAGGIVTDFQGGNGYLLEQNIIAGNRQISPKLLQILRSLNE